MSVLAAYSGIACNGNHPQRPMIDGGIRSSGYLVLKWRSGAELDPGDLKKKKRSRRFCNRTDAAATDLSRSDDTLEIEAIGDSNQLDQILLQARHRSQPVLIDWMAAWCRKCIYLKPKLEKLATEYKEKMRFYYVDVNNVSKDLVKRGSISKMPTIQVWKDGEMKEEVIGGHQAWLVLEEVREMIQRFV